MKKALLIGINYIGTTSELQGCINDIMNIKIYIMKTYSIKEKNIMILCDNINNKPNYDNILKAFDWLMLGAKKGDSLFMHYSGHGTWKLDKNNDEEDRRDEFICPLDYINKGFISDDLINTKLVMKVPKDVKLTCIFDCCHSGTIMDLKYGLKRIGNSDIITENKLIKNKPNGNIMMLSGCMDLQTSADTTETNILTNKIQNQGALTWGFLELMKINKNKIKINKFVKQIQDLMKIKKYTQLPQVSFNKYPNLNDNFILL